MTAVRRPGRSLPLRARVTATFAGLALVTTATVSLVTFFLSRTYVLEQRDRLATSQAFSNARLAQNQLRADDPAPEEVVGTSRGEAGTQVLLRFGGRWYTSAVSLDQADLPGSLTERVSAGEAARQRFENRGVTNLVVGVPIPSVNALYYEVSPLIELRRTLDILAVSLVVASVIATLLGAIGGLVVGRRLLRPLRRISAVAVDVAEGQLDKRLDAEGDDDLEPLVDSFNQMVGALQVRIEREARFASDVSHELRTPLTTLATGIEIVQSRSDEMPERAAMAVGLLAEQVKDFQRLVLDLLEISRLDAGAEVVSVEELDAVAFVSTTSRELDGPPVTVETAGPWEVLLDRRRVERVLRNLFENADRYANGVSRIALARIDDGVRISIDDDGPGIPPADRDHVFERFWRGSAARQRAAGGTGLGLALVAEHVRLLHGSIELADAPSGGARFVLWLPADGWPA